MFGNFFHAVFYQPLYNVIVFFYDVAWYDFGIAIILTTLLLKVVLIPLTNKQIASQKQLQEVQPKIKALQHKYKDDKERQTKEIMNFYKENKVNPFGGCLPLIIQMFFFFAIYRIIFNTSNNGFNVHAADLYAFVANPGSINHLFLNFLDLTAPSIALAVLTAIAQYVQLKMMMKNQPKPEEKPASTEPDIATMMNKQMVVLMPIMILVFGIKLAAALTLYWLVSTLFMIGQQQYILKIQEAKSK
jgi:YidC/Oxa1 family membrane protein insertase